jgi:pimeloyl-ACP methyl ester carboxylesterase
MQIEIRRCIPIGVIVVALAFAPRLSRAHQGDDSEDARGAAADEGREEGRCAYRDRDFYVSHVSTVPANVGDEVKLFVRERGNSCGPPVLMLTGATQPAMVPFDLQFVDVEKNSTKPLLSHYSWMTYLAKAGFDVFAMDLQGYGLSTRPAVMDNPCNASTSDRALHLVPPLEPGGACPTEYAALRKYSNLLTWSHSEWDEIDSVVNYILAARHRERVSLIGWSQGGPRAGGYASEHPEKVERLFLYAPAYNWNDPTTSPTGPFPPGSPISIRTVKAFFAQWDGMVDPVKCPDEFDPVIRAQLSASLVQFDPLAATWGTEPLWRAPAFNLPPSTTTNPNPRPGEPLKVPGRAYGWNSAAAAKIHMPTLLIRGDNDTQVAFVEVANLYSDISSESKVFVHVACGAHQLVWERQHMALLDASAQWLKDGRYNGERNGCFAVDTSGNAKLDTSNLTPCGR